jgi:hypothetical protein
MVDFQDLFSDGRHRSKQRGITLNDLSDAAERAFTEGKYGCYKNVWPRTPGGSDSGDPYDSQMKPKDVPVWDHVPATPAEEELYYGAHIHSESNPLGLHTHVPGGTLAGGHTHGPQNRFGVHHHQGSEDNPESYAETLDGKHLHEGANFPDGNHEHLPENFG